MTARFFIDKIVLRRVAAYDEKNNKAIEIITNQLEWEAATIGALYKKRWDIELFFKALKQNLQVKTFIGTSMSAITSVPLFAESSQSHQTIFSKIFSTKTTFYYCKIKHLR
jgi:Transposase DDE domain